MGQSIVTQHFGPECIELRALRGADAHGRLASEQMTHTALAEGLRDLVDDLTGTRGSKRSVLSAARSAGCSQEREEMSIRVVRGMRAPLR